MNKINELHIFAMASHGVGISGGDRIWIELARRWINIFPITVHTWSEGKGMAERQNLLENKDLRFKIYELGSFCELGFVICYLARIIKGIFIGLTLKIKNEQGVYLYNASEFWMDAFPCVLLKIRYPKIKWIATWYQTAPNPFKGYVEQSTENKEQRTRENKYFMKALVYWLVQLPVKPFIKKYADNVIVNNEDEKSKFPKHTRHGNTIVMIGAVPLDDIKQYRSQFTVHSSQQRYDAVFQGRFHPQKGVVELINIWKHVITRMPNAKLAMIGDGPLMEDVKLQISNVKLGNNVKLFGYLFDGSEKYSIFSQSKLVLHPAFYDSGGMATAEAMAFGIPAIGFNLKAYESYYPKGMIKVTDEKEFAAMIVKLLNDDQLRNKIGKEAKELIEKSYSWDVRAEEILNQIGKEADAEINSA